MSDGARRPLDLVLDDRRPAVSSTQVLPRRAATREDRLQEHDVRVLHEWNEVGVAIHIEDKDPLPRVPLETWVLKDVDSISYAPSMGSVRPSRW